MKQYNFKNFFKKCCVHDNDFFSNSHFLLKKSILTKKQQEYINNFKENPEKINFILERFKDFFNTNREDLIEFIPTHVTTDYKYITDQKIVFNKEYYNFITAKGCKIYYYDILKPAPVYKNDKCIGIIMPVENAKLQLITLTEYKKQKYQKKKENEKYFISKVITYTGIKRKYFEFIKEVNGLKFYALKNQIKEYDKAFISVNNYMIGICLINNIKNAAEQIIRDNINIHEYIKNIFERDLNNNRIVSLGIAEYLNRLDEAKNHNKKIQEQRKELEKEKQIQEGIKRLKEEEQHKQYLTEQSRKYIAGEEITGNVFYELCKQYNIEIPIRTAGWIKNNLVTIKYKDDCTDYTHYKNNSKKIHEVAHELYNRLKR